MVAKVTIESGYQPGTGIGLARRGGEIKPVKQNPIWDFLIFSFGKQWNWVLVLGEGSVFSLEKIKDDL